MAKYDLYIREEELKHKVARDWFANYDTTQIIDNIDFAVAIQPQGNELFKQTEYLLWAEAKKGNTKSRYVIDCLIYQGLWDHCLPEELNTEIN